MMYGALNWQGWKKRDNPEDEYKFQDKELIEDLGFYEYDFGARYYDPQLGRWSVNDPANQFASGYMGMGNDPANGIDPDGRWFGWDDLAAAAIGFVAGYVSSGINTGDWGGKSLKAGATGAVSGWLAYNTGGFAASKNLGEYVTTQIGGIVGSQVLPSETIQAGNLSLTISPAFSTSGLGINANVNYSDENISLGAGIGIGYFTGTNDLTGKFKNDSKGFYSSWSINGGAVINSTFYGGAFGKTNTSGKLSQTIGIGSVRIGDFAMRLDEDYLGDGEDRWRTGGITLTYKINQDISVGIGFAAVTGQRDPTKDLPVKYGKYSDGYGYKGATNPDSEIPYGYRSGVFYGGIIYKGKASFIGLNNEKILHRFQNPTHDSSTFNTNYYFGEHWPPLGTKNMELFWKL